MAGLIISFQGMDANKGHIQAFAGIESAAGLARALTLIGHYVATGTVRRRFPFDETVQFYLETMENGSFNWKVTVKVGGALALGLATNAIYDVMKLTFSKAAAGEEATVSSQVEKLNQRHSGDIDALVEAIEPALKKAHYGIGETANKIVIEESSSRKVIFEFNSKTKDYMIEDVDGIDDVQDVSISALNVNDKTGRAYFVDLRRTVPFKVSSTAKPNTMSTLSAALKRYADHNPATTQIHFSKIEAIDGRLKRIIIFSAEDVSDVE